jgi:hypothetical protein
MLKFNRVIICIQFCKVMENVSEQKCLGVYNTSVKRWRHPYVFKNKVLWWDLGKLRNYAMSGKHFWAVTGRNFFCFVAYKHMYTARHARTNSFFSFFFFRFKVFRALKMKFWCWRQRQRVPRELCHVPTSLHGAKIQTTIMISVLFVLRLMMMMIMMFCCGYMKLVFTVDCELV